MVGVDWWPRVWGVLQSDHDLSEEATKQRIVEPTLAYLGWDLYGTEVQREYAVDERGRNESVDYALVLGDVPLILLEVKKLRNPLGDKEARQVLGYARLEEIRWCALTNGRKWKLYNADWSKEPDDALFREWELTAGPGFPDAIQILSRGPVAAGELDRTAGESMRSQRMLQELNKVLPELQEASLKLARNRLFAEVRERFPDLTRASIDQFVQERLQLSLRTATTVPPSSVANPPSRSPLRLPDAPDFPLLDIDSLPDEEVVVFPSKPTGIPWMKRYNAWGYVKLSRLSPYLALYVSGGVGRIRYLAETESIVAPEDPESPVRDAYKTDPSYERGKMVIVLRRGSIRRLDREIPIGANKSALRTHRFFRLSSFASARTVDDLR